GRGAGGEGGRTTELPSPFGRGAGGEGGSKFCVIFCLFPLLSAFSLLLSPLSAAELTPAAERSIDKGLKWLAAGQHDDGSFGAGQYRGNAAVSALAGMALISGGSTPGRGPYGEQLQRCVDYLLGCVRPSGFISGGDAARGPMYGHGFATMFLAECHGMAPRDELREKLKKAVKIIVDCQNAQGGWRYQPVPNEADVSVTACEIMALRAARNAGLFVPNETVDRAIEYVKKCQNADGGFAYMLQGSRASAFPRSAAAATALMSAGVYTGPEIDRGLEYLMRFLPGKEKTERETYYYYGQYYAAQATWIAGGERWQRWYPAARDELIARQRDDGAWVSANGNHYATAVACIVLQMPNNYLPIFER
ncbi:MAG: terpene cyclase/mutase family protein, partial [Pirellulales bacterium]|nr:terpene cyclase/mutase family protein [Pirellulales bacterium]